MAFPVLKQRVLAWVPPGILVPLAAIRARRHSQRLTRRWGLARLSERLFEEIGRTVQAGPFAGLMLPRGSAAEHVGPYLLGTYERELHPFWLTVAPGSVPLIINVGSKIGYYAAGLARRLGAPAVAYDADPWARRITRDAARLNRVRVDVRGTCRRHHFQSLPSGALVVIDCDGGEEMLLREPLPRGLATSIIVLELHGPLLDHDEMADRLRRTHDVTAVPSAEAPPPSGLAFLDDHERQLVVQEIRTPQRWLLCRPLISHARRV